MKIIKKNLKNYVGLKFKIKLMNNIALFMQRIIFIINVQ